MIGETVNGICFFRLFPMLFLSTFLINTLMLQLVKIVTYGLQIQIKMMKYDEI